MKLMGKEISTLKTNAANTEKTVSAMLLLSISFLINAKGEIKLIKAKKENCHEDILLFIIYAVLYSGHIADIASHIF